MIIKSKNCIIVGDLNIDLMKHETHYNTGEFLNTMLSHGFMPTILLPTRVTNHSCTLIDHIFYYSKTFKNNFLTGNLFTDISDHFANFLLLDSNKKFYPKERPNVRIFGDENKEKFRSILSEMNWEYELENKNVNDSMNIFYHTIVNAYNKLFSLVKLSRKRAKDKPWVTTGLKKSIKEKQRLFRIYKFNHSVENEQKYKKYNNELRTIIRQSEINYFKKMFDHKKNSIKMLWSNLGNILSPDKRHKSNSIDRLLIDGNEVKDDSEIADSLNEYFASVGQNLSNNVPEVSGSYKDYLKNPVSASVFLKPTDIIEVGTQISKMKNNKSGIDIFRINLIKCVKNEIVQGLTMIINKSISEGIVPDLLKIAKIIPVYKKDDAFLPSNYRPISLLSIFHKLLEKIICVRLKQFLKKHNILYKYQFGFSENHSTSHALIDVVEYIYKSLDDNKFVFGVYIDLKKAFDTVDHDILLAKLEHYGIRGNALKWFKSYLSKR